MTFEFALGESEVKRASDLSEDEEYVIVLVTHALSPARRRIHPLPILCQLAGSGSTR